jgi:hypothetical protein
MSTDSPHTSSSSSPPRVSRLSSGCRNRIIATLVSAAIVVGLLLLVADFQHQGEEIGESRDSNQDFGSATRVLEVEPAAEWRVVQGDGFSIYLPQRLEPLSAAEFERITGASMIDLSGAKTMVMALDAHRARFGTNVTLTAIPVADNMTPGEYVSSVASEIKTDGYSIKDQSVYELEGRSVGRLIYETTTAQGHRASGVQFAYAEGRTIWVVTCTALSAELHDWLPVFETIASRFEFQ